MTLQQLKYAVAIADHHSISEAAKSLYISQPTLSNSIRDLEKELGLSIFHRTNKGIHLSVEGGEFIGYARQVIEQSDLLEERFLNKKPRKQRFAVSTQHYSFAVNAFVDLIRLYGMDEYDFTLRETRTVDIIEDVHHLRSEIGIIYLDEFNRKVIGKLLNDSDLTFHFLFAAKPHVFISRNNPLATKASVTLEDLEPYPYLCFEQGENSMYLAEEVLSSASHKRSIHVSDRATLFNLVIGLNGYTVSSGILDEELNGDQIIPIPLDVENAMEIGYITHKSIRLSALGQKYIESLLLP